MGKDCESRFPKWPFDWKSSYISSDIPISPGLQIPVTSFCDHEANMVTAKWKFPLCASSVVPDLRVGQANESRPWFYCLPRFRQAFVPALNSPLKDEFPCPNETGFEQKRFLVIDQSGDQTSLIFSSWSPKLHGAYNKGIGRTKEDLDHRLKPVLTSEFGENHEADVQSEMQEDTEELNALLYSDDESEADEDDEVTSTGHSPSTMTAHEKQYIFEGRTEEVATSVGPTKKRKKFDGFHNEPPPVDSSISSKHRRLFEQEDDTESSCSNEGNYWLLEEDSLLSNKKMRKENIQETVSILQSIIPGSKGKESIVVLEEASRYLETVNLRAKAFGLDG